MISAQNGFTKYLQVFARSNPGAMLQVSVEGPYGTLPTFISFDKIVLVSGGSGGSFIFGAAVDAVKTLGLHGKTQIDLIWVISRKGQLATSLQLVMFPSNSLLQPDYPHLKLHGERSHPHSYSHSVCQRTQGSAIPVLSMAAFTSPDAC